MLRTHINHKEALNSNRISRHTICIRALRIHRRLNRVRRSLVSPNKGDILVHHSNKEDHTVLTNRHNRSSNILMDLMRIIVMAMALMSEDPRLKRNTIIMRLRRNSSREVLLNPEGQRLKARQAPR